MPITTETVTQFAGCTACECGVVGACAEEAFIVAIKWATQWLAVPLIVVTVSLVAYITIARRTSSKRAKSYTRAGLIIALLATVALWLLTYIPHTVDRRNTEVRREELMHTNACYSPDPLSEQDSLLCEKIRFDNVR